MQRHVLPGAALAVTGGLIVLLGGWLNLELDSVALLGAALGGCLALVPDRGPAAKVAGFAAGFLVAWGGYLLRTVALPDAPSGRAVAVALVVAACALVALATSGRLPLWSLLLGAAAMVGAYEATYVASPTTVAADSVTAATSVLLATALAFVVAALVGESVRREPAEGAAQHDVYDANEPHGGPFRDDDNQDDSDESMVAQR